MPTYTTYLGVTKLAAGQSNAHVTVNEALDVLDKSIAGRLGINLVGLSTKTLTGAESTNHILHVTATDRACDLVVQATVKSWIVINDGSHTVTVKRSGQTSPSPPSILAAGIKDLLCDGTNIRQV